MNNSSQMNINNNPSISQKNNSAELYQQYQFTSKKQFKSELIELLINEIEPIRTEYNQLINDPLYLQQIANNGAKYAKNMAKTNLKQIKQQMY